ncbi:MAG: MBL fold metallo-hydrolase [Chloroflexi bacterium]|nr:MBL fold metallo-hydrolase [Chloroflexota bacterium]
MSTQLVLLGTGTPNADPDRSGPALAIVADGVPYLVDFGPGGVRRAAAAHRNGIDALQVSNLTRAFLTHLHSDHTAGYPDLILTPWVLGREEPLHVYGPPGLQAMTGHILAAYAQAIHERLTGLEPANDGGHQVHATEIAPGRVYADERVTVDAFAVDHGSWPAFGFKFTTPDRIIVISGDTTPQPNVIEHATGCDILVHEAYSVAGFAKRPPEWQTYHRAVHTSAHQLAEIASQARPGLLVLVHQLYWGTSDDDLLAEVRAHYDGPVVSGQDLDVF